MTLTPVRRAAARRAIPAHLPQPLETADANPPWWLRWPVPALAAWALAWALFAALRQVPALPAVLSAAFAGSVPAVLAFSVRGGLRRLWVMAGFPVSAVLLGAGGPIPGWAWLVPLALLLAIYPLRAWRDAPMFPTDAAALSGLGRRIPLPERARVLDAGCGLGHGLVALRAEFPHACTEGVERSRLLSWGARWRCRQSRIACADMWDLDWGDYQAVYLFQRPETMARAWQKARDEMQPGAWLISLEFEVPGAVAHLRLDHAGHRPLFVYRVPVVLRSVPPAQPPRPAADKSVRRARSSAAA